MKAPRFPELKPLGLEDREIVTAALRRHPAEICELTFANLFIWREVESPKFTFINGNLCVLCTPPAEPAYFLQPVGEEKISETLGVCLTIAPRLSRVSGAFARQHCGSFRCEPDRSNFDYVYEAAELISLQGKKYDGKRNHIRRFEKAHAFAYRRLTAADCAGCQELLDEWLAVKAANSNSVAGSWKPVIQEACAHLDRINLTGGVIETGGRVVAFSIGGRLNPDTAVIHIEIVHPGYDGLSQLINREFIRHEWADCRFINREQDCGIPGLRRAKMSYCPHHLVEKYNVMKTP
ncbi:MAG: hypothetical protein A2W03_02425 [Candidatus Aminicenantes bacterium RBG_16_63_16]|nr:MAG: hypothetical protein A2W03_02425 [Candidatus Aminicenantes bacterium RBG_16_63_16]